MNTNIFSASFGVFIEIMSASSFSLFFFRVVLFYIVNFSLVYDFLFMSMHL